MVGLLRLYVDVPADANKLDLAQDTVEFDKTEDTDRLAIVNEWLGLSNAALLPLGLQRTVLQDEADTINARLMFYGMPNTTVNLTVREGDWFSPDSVNSFCGETSPNVATNSIDANTATHWRHVLNERHSIVYKMRDFAVRIERIRFFYNTSLPVNEQLTNLDVHMAKELANIDDAANILETGLNITWPGTGGVWVEHTLATPKASAVYIKLLFDTASAVNTGQIREFECFVTPRKP